MSQPPDAAQGLTENHLRRVYATCQHIDKLLSAIERAMDPAGRDDPFHRYEHVLSQQARTGIVEVLRGFRSSLGAVLSRHRIPFPPAHQDRFTIQSTVEFIDADIMDLRPEHMGGYGALHEPAASDLTAIVQEFSGHVSALRGILQQETPAAARRETRHDGE